MRFGESYSTFKDKQSAGGGGTDYIRTFKEGDTTGVFLTGPDQWVGYLEHYNPNPGGYSFPCTQQPDCPGCASDQEKMVYAGSKVAIPMLVEDKWVNVYKVPKKFAERMAKRAMKDMSREYTITRVGTSVDTDYDIESGDRVTLGEHEIPDIEKMLEELFEQTWGGEQAPKADRVTASPASSPKTEQKSYSEEDLRELSPTILRAILRSEGDWSRAPSEIRGSEDTDEIVDWMVKVAAQ